MRNESFRPGQAQVTIGDYASRWIFGSALFFHFQPTAPIRTAAGCVVSPARVSARGTGKFLCDRRHRRSIQSGNLLAFEDQPKPIGNEVAM